ncbi:MAG: helix-turn-helix transcriptional regulator [Rhodospirillaceae bacterium]|nr:helix-turn-helix transcriptional regulator [Rhodospirillales bacterium]
MTIDIDKRIGARIRELRTLEGFNQKQLAAAIGVTFQQLHKYERGTNRISASRLHLLACAMGVSVSYFTDDQPQVNAAHQRPRLMLELSRHFCAMSGHQQDAMMRMARVITDSPAVPA